MAFSELRLSAEDMGLSFDEGRSLLYGEKSGYGVTVADTGDNYEVRLFCVAPYKSEAAVFDTVGRLCESLPKNAIEKQSCEYGYIRVVLNKYMLLQENIVYLIGFLEKLTDEVGKLGIAPESYRLPKVETQPVRPAVPAKNVETVKLGFDIRSVSGFIGALLGAFAVTVISILVIDIKTEAEVFGLSSEISSYIVSAAATALIFFDYVFLARKLDAFGVITCPVLSVLSVLASAFGAGIKAVCAVERVSPREAIASFAEFTAKNDFIDKFLMGYMTRGILLAVIASIAVCVWYFNKHPNETTDDEKVIFTDEKK